IGQQFLGKLQSRSLASIGDGQRGLTDRIPAATARRLYVGLASRAPRSRLTDVVDRLQCALVPGTVSTTVKGAIRFHAVADDLAATVMADGCQLMDGTFNAVEYMALP